MYQQQQQQQQQQKNQGDADEKQQLLVGNNDNQIVQQQEQVINKDNEDFEELNEKKLPCINSICINQSKKLIGLCTQFGYRIYVNNFFDTKQKEVNIRENDDFLMKCGINVMSFLYDTLIIALVTNGTNKLYPNSNVYIMDEKYNKVIDFYEFYQQIVMLQYMREFLLLATQEKIILYNIKEKKPLRYIIDVEKPVFFSCNQNYDFFSYAFKLQGQKGKISLAKVHSSDAMLINYNADEQLNSSSINLIANASNYDIANITISHDSTRIALVEQGGKRIKIFDLETLKLLKVLIRGRSDKNITQIQFSKDNRFLALISSNKAYSVDNQNTLHIFDLEDKKLQKSIRKYKFNEWKQNIKVSQNQQISKTQINQPSEYNLILFSDDNNSITVISAADFALRLSLDIEKQNYEIQEVVKDYKKIEWI